MPSILLLLIAPLSWFSLISGPAGTGKTESVKALGHQLGRFVLVFNCDETFDFQVRQCFVSENEFSFVGLRKCVSVCSLMFPALDKRLSTKRCFCLWWPHTLLAF